MKVIISKTALVALISKIQGVVPSKPSLPVLGNVLIEAVADQLLISGTDLTVSMRAYAEAKVLEEGAITLPARKFFQLIRELTAPQIEIHCTTPEIAYINAGTSHFKIQGMHKSEFPQLPDFSEGIATTVPPALLKEMLTRSAFAAARDDERQVLNGIYLQIHNNQVVFLATDGKRLAKLWTPVDLPADYTSSFIIPLKAVEEMVKILDEKEPLARLIFMKDKISLEVGSITLISKLLSGQYPDVSRVIPEKSQAPITVHREELASLLRQVSLFTTEDSASVRFSFVPGELHLSAMSGEIGEGKVSMPVNYGGEKLEVAFKPHYFLDILRHSKDETIEFDITDPYNPALITDSSSALFVIMPMRLET
ncbi:MAG: DNA polymerase III subunit beta [Chlamydiota bacterium]